MNDQWNTKQLIFFKFNNIKAKAIRFIKYDLMVIDHVYYQRVQQRVQQINKNHSQKVTQKQQNVCITFTKQYIYT